MNDDVQKVRENNRSNSSWKKEKITNLDWLMWRGFLWTKVFVLVLMVGSDTRLTYYNRLSRRRLGWWAERGKMSPLLFQDFALFHFLFHVFSHWVSKETVWILLRLVLNKMSFFLFLYGRRYTHTSIKRRRKENGTPFLVCGFCCFFLFFWDTTKILSFPVRPEIPQTWSTLLITHFTNGFDQYWNSPIATNQYQLVRPNII